MDLNGLLGFKDPTHLMPTQTHPFDTPTHPVHKILAPPLVEKLFFLNLWCSSASNYHPCSALLLLKHETGDKEDDMQLDICGNFL
jgi:hypothetical protein